MSKVNRDQIARRLGIPTKRLAELSHRQQIRLPISAAKIGNLMLYDAALVDAWLATEPLKKENLLRVVVERSYEKPRLDNVMAQAWLARPILSDVPLTMTALADKHKRRSSPTRVVQHCIERH
jgi:hypothetical protein